MEKIIEERTIKVDVIKFDDGTQIDARIIMEFLDEAYEFEHTIGKTGNWTNDYMYFETDEEKILEPILVQLDVIRKSPNHKYHNDKVGKEKYYDYYYYWLSDGYQPFWDKFYELLG